MALPWKPGATGRTIGKMAMGIRVVTTSGHPIGGGHAMLRNLIAVADLAPAISLQFFHEELPPVYMIPTGMIAIVTMVCSRRMQRLGDLAAGTMVVIDERGWTLPVTKVEDARVPALASFFPPDYRVSPSMAQSLALYAERRAFLSPQRRREVARHLAGPLIYRFEFREDIDPDLMLYALYWRTFLADQRDQDIDLGPWATVSPLARDANVPAEATALHDPVVSEVVHSVQSIENQSTASAVAPPPTTIAAKEDSV